MPDLLSDWNRMEVIVSGSSVSKVLLMLLMMLALVICDGAAGDTLGLIDGGGTCSCEECHNIK